MWQPDLNIKPSGSARPISLYAELGNVANV